MSLVFHGQKTFDRAFKALLFPMVMAAEPGKCGSDPEESSNFSIPNPTSVPKICAIPGELNRNGSKILLSSGNKKHEENWEFDSQNGEVYDKLSEDDSSNNNLKPSDVSSSHRDQLLLLHLDLIERQQQLIQEKDREILQLRDEKEQLEGRIKRMERRMAIKSRNHYDDNDVDILTLSTSSRDRKLLQKRMNRKPSLSELMRRKSIPAAAPVLMSSTVERCANIDTCLRTKTLYMDSDIMTEKLGQTLQETKDYRICCDDVPTPQFRIVENYASLQASGTTIRSSLDCDVVETTYESLDDDTFGKRHTRPETDEKRRKRWDIQHYRAKKQREELQEKYNQREEARLKGRKVVEPEQKSSDDTLLPDCMQTSSSCLGLALINDSCRSEKNSFGVRPGIDGNREEDSRKHDRIGQQQKIADNYRRVVCVIGGLAGVVMKTKSPLS